MIELAALVLAILAFALYGSGEPRPPLDAVVLAEDTAGMRPALMRTVAPQLKAGDRMAVMTFRQRARVVQPFTADADAVRWALLRVPRGDSEAHPFEAVADAARLLGTLPADAARRRAVILVFGSEDPRPQPAAARAALEAAGARLYVNAVMRAYPVHSSGLQTPPPQYATKPLPEETLQALKPMAADVATGSWDLRGMVKRVVE